MLSAIKPVHALLNSVRQSTGLTSAAIYDTAQGLRFQPDLVEREAIIEWLLSQQDADGGWGTATMPMARLIPTLACTLALQEAPPAVQTTHALDAAKSFLTVLSTSWPAAIPDDLPVGMELLLPGLLAQVRQAGMIDLDPTPFRAIIEIGQHRHEKLAQRSLTPGSPPLHSYEALSLPAHADLLDGEGSLSHSPAATASWLQRVGTGATSLAPRAARERALAYLARCTSGTPAPIPGVYPGLWPVNRFEQCFVLYFFAAAGAFDLPAYREQLVAAASDLARAMRPTGIGLSDQFTVDGDDTAAAIIVLLSAGLPVCRSWLSHFRAGARYYAFPGERHGSISLIARAMHAAMLIGEDGAETAAYLRSQQQPDGSWANDKWHTSWLYVTMHVMIALAYNGDYNSVARASAAILHAQRPDGGWGTAEETAYALLGLTYAYRACTSHNLLRAIYAGRCWLRNSASRPAKNPPLWIGKELYTYPHIVESAIQAALIAVNVLSHEDKLEVLC